MKKIITLLAVLFFFSNCQVDTETQNIKVKNQYSIDLPKSFSKVDFLHEDASLQYQNILSEFYTIVIDEPSSDFDNLVLEDASLRETYTPDLTGYSKLLKDNLAATIKNGKFSKFEDTKINGNQAKLMTVNGTVDGIDVFYQFGFVKGKETYYQIVNWTELKRKEDHAASMEKIISSFKELNRSKKKMP